MPNDQILLTPDTWLLVLTGAGISAESGIPTFRDQGGLWEQHRVEDVASPEGFARDPQLVWRFYSARRTAAARCQPNAGHRALAALEPVLGKRLLLATQNVDGLHTAAGSRRVLELHGSLFQTRCAACDRPPFVDRKTYDEPPLCELCQDRGSVGLLRPHIVWFGEYLDDAHLHAIDDFLEAAGEHRLVFLAVGTSGAVYPAAGFVDAALEAGAETWLVNQDPAANTSSFHHFLRGPAGTILPDLFHTP